MSKGILGPTVTVVGFSWCKAEPKDIGLASLTANHLCQQHNSDLSPVDQAGKDAFTAFRDAAVLANKRSQETPRKRTPTRFEADGTLLERWFLKTAINLTLVQPTENTWQLTGQHLHDVPELLVRAAFSLDQLETPMGLYTAANVGESIAFSDSVVFAPVVEQSGEVYGFTFTFQGMRFLLWVAAVPIPPRLVLPNAREPAWVTSSLYRHLAYLQWKIGGRHLSHYVDVRWPGKKTPSWVYSP